MLLRLHTVSKEIEQNLIRVTENAEICFKVCMHNKTIKGNARHSENEWFKVANIVVDYMAWKAQIISFKSSLVVICMASFKD